MHAVRMINIGELYEYKRYDSDFNVFCSYSLLLEVSDETGT